MYMITREIGNLSLFPRAQALRDKSFTNRIIWNKLSKEVEETDTVPFLWKAFVQVHG